MLHQPHGRFYATDAIHHIAADTAPEADLVDIMDDPRSLMVAAVFNMPVKTVAKLVREVANGQDIDWT